MPGMAALELQRNEVFPPRLELQQLARRNALHFGNGVGLCALFVSTAPITTQAWFASERARLALLWAAWALFSLWCVRGFAPALDLPAHAAQMQTLADIVRGRADVVAHYRATFPIGYGGTSWLFLPVTLLSSGALAARLALWVALVLFPLGHAALARATGRSAWVAALGAPLAFGISYWFGFLPTVFALPWVLWTWAVFLGAVEAPSFPKTAAALLGLLSTGVLLLHLVTWGALAVGLFALALASQKRRRAWLLVGCTLAVPSVIAVAQVARLLLRTLEPGPHEPSQYDAVAHFNWVFRAYDTEGRISVIAMALLTLLFVTAGVRAGKQNAPIPWALFAAMSLLYVVTPKAVGGAWLVHVRLLPLVGAAALLLVDVKQLNLSMKVAASGLVAVCLFTVGARHLKFAKQTAGLGQLIATPAPVGPHGGFFLKPAKPDDTRIHLYEHLPQWWTATHGGAGHHFFANADHQPVRFVAGHELPALLDTGSSRADVESFRALLVWGEGPLPDTLVSFKEVARAGAWRRLER